MANGVDKQAEKEQLERRRLARLIDALPAFSGFASSDGHLTQTRPDTEETFIWALPAFAYSHDSVTQIVDLCERAATGQRVQVERRYLKDSTAPVDTFARGLLTLTPIEEETGRIDEIAISLVDCDDNGLPARDPRTKTRLSTANTRIETMLSLAQTVIEVTQESPVAGGRRSRIQRDRLSARLDALASVIDLVSNPDRDEVDIATLVKLALRSLPSAERRERVRLSLSQGAVPMDMVPLVALLLSELVDNARDHGSLSDPDRAGRLFIESEIADGPMGQHLKLHWIEDGGPPVPAVLSPRFGLTLADKLFPQVTGGTVQMLNTEEGLSWSFELPLAEPQSGHGLSPDLGFQP
ncbi:MAG: sensor histidine kinase [Litorimonas sp.]